MGIGGMNRKTTVRTTQEMHARLDEGVGDSSPVQSEQCVSTRQSANIYELKQGQDASRQANELQTPAL